MSANDKTHFLLVSGENSSEKILTVKHQQLTSIRNFFDSNFGNFAVAIKRPLASHEQRKTIFV